MGGGAWWAAVHGVAKSWIRLSDFTFTFHFHALEKEMATHSSVLAWRIPGTGEPDGLPFMGLHRVGHDWSALAAAAAAAACCISQGSQQPIVCVSQLVGQRNRFIFKESAHTIIEAENSGPRRVDGVCYSKSKSRGRRSVSQLKDGQAERNFFWTQPFILFRPSKDSIRPTHIGRQSGFTHPTD